MTKADYKLIDDAIIKHGDDWWNDPNDNDKEEEAPNPNRGWAILEILDFLEKDGLDLKVIRKVPQAPTQSSQKSV